MTRGHDVDGRWQDPRFDGFYPPPAIHVWTASAHVSTGHVLTASTLVVGRAGTTWMAGGGASTRPCLTQGREREARGRQEAPLALRPARAHTLGYIVAGGQVGFRVPLPLTGVLVAGGGAHACPAERGWRGDEILYCDPKGRRALLRTPSTEGRRVCLCWAPSKPKGPQGRALRRAHWGQVMSRAQAESNKPRRGS